MVARCGYCKKELKGGRTKFCSRRCSEKHRRDTRRDRLWAARVEDVDLEVLFRRAKGICNKCGAKLSLRYMNPNPLAPTVDHIVPIAQGGEHSYKNAQLLCLACNTGKGAVG